MNIINEIDFTKVITIVTLLSSAISIIISKIFENIQESKKHKRLIEEKVLDTKLDACKSAIKYYGTFFNHLYNTKYIFESLENQEYSKLINEANKFYDESLKKIQLDGEYHKILLFYDFYSEEDEKIAEKLMEKMKNYVDITNNTSIYNLDSEEEKRLRAEIIEVINEAINYSKKKIKLVRDDIRNLVN